MIATDTIAAIATGSGRTALGIIRLSGPEAFSIMQHVWKGKPIAEIQARSIAYGSITDGEKEVIDDVVITKFLGPHSFTGEDVIEISAHGSPNILADIMAALIHRGARAATAGEYTRRAFMNGKLDLAQAEAVGDMIASESRAARRVALQQMRGGVSQAIVAMREKLLHFAAMLELELDFSEEDVAFADRTELQKLLTTLNTDITRLLSTFAGGRAMKDGIRVAILGRPNAGKSTLLNLLLQDDRAIVSPTAGTTRDTVEDTLHLGDYLFRLTDTAGLRHTEDEIENMGIARSMAALQKADMALYLYDNTAMTQDEVSAHIQELRLMADMPKEMWISLGTHAENVLHDDECCHRLQSTNETEFGAHWLVSLTGEHSPTLMQNIHSFLISAAWLLTGARHYNADALMITNARHHEALHMALTHLHGAQSALSSSLPSELLAHHLRHAITGLSTITGHISPDDILGEIFGKFCIGK